MKKLFLVPALFLLVASLTSCERDADIELPEVSPKLVITCFISPQDTMVMARITRSRPIFESSNVNTNYSVPNATVTITGPSGSVQLTYNSMYEWYSVPASQFPIQAGATYTIAASTPHLSASATTTVPAAAPQNFNCSLRVYTEDSSSTAYTHHYYADCSWNDFAGQADFYRLIWVKISKSYLNPQDTLYQKEGSALVSDKDNDGHLLEYTTENFQTYFQYAQTDTLIGFDLYLVHGSPEYYLYHQSLWNYSGGDPFSEPSLIYTNVSGGLGIFAGFNSDKKHFDF